MYKSKIWMEDLKNFCKKYDITISDLPYLINYEVKTEKTEEIKSKVEENKRYVGKFYKEKISPRNGMFPEMYRYYKIISERSSHQGYVSCLTFDEHPCYWFEYQSHRILFEGDFFLGNFDFDSIWIDELRVDKLDKLEEIMEEEFNGKLDEFVEEMKKMNWVPDHYRFGGKKPGDEGWEVK